MFGIKYDNNDENTLSGTDLRLNHPLPRIEGRELVLRVTCGKTRNCRWRHESVTPARDESFMQNSPSRWLWRQTVCSALSFSHLFRRHVDFEREWPRDNKKESVFDLPRIVQIIYTTNSPVPYIYRSISQLMLSKFWLEADECLRG
jgi:hypothetical protein